MCVCAAAVMVGLGNAVQRLRTVVDRPVELIGRSLDGVLECQSPSDRQPYPSYTNDGHKWPHRRAWTSGAGWRRRSVRIVVSPLLLSLHALPFSDYALKSRMNHPSNSQHEPPCSQAGPPPSPSGPRRSTCPPTTSSAASGPCTGPHRCACSLPLWIAVFSPIYVRGLCPAGGYTCRGSPTKKDLSNPNDSSPKPTYNLKTEHIHKHAYSSSVTPPTHPHTQQHTPQALVNANSAFISSIVGKYFLTGVDASDLFQEGVEGFLKYVWSLFICVGVIQCLL